MIAIRPAGYGKLPGSGEFLRVGVDEIRARAIDAQAEPLLRTLQAAPAKKAAYRRAQPACCIQVNPTSGWRISVWFASGDGVGRDFPLVIGTDLDGVGLDTSELLAAGLDLAGRAVHAVSSQEPRDLGELRALLDGLTYEFAPGAEVERVTQAMHTQLASRFWRQCLGVADEALRDRVIRVLLDPAREAVAWRYLPSPTASHFLFWLLLWERLHGRRPDALILQAVVDERPPACVILPQHLDERLRAALLWPGVVELGAGRRLATPLSPPEAAAAEAVPDGIGTAGSVADLLHSLIRTGTTQRRRSPT